jgi:cell division protein FtsL
MYISFINLIFLIIIIIFKMWFILAVYKEKKLLNEDAVEMVSTETLEVLDYDIFDQPIVQFYNELTKLDQR